ncbi:MAG: hypothetical protein H7Y04_15895 [Verrucomicrobia bacterium]|nr:hypothetical protein [Cytophagales bacterium]
MEIQRMPIGEIMEKLVEALDINFNQLAEQTGERPDKFYRMKNQGIKPSYETMQQILEAYPQVSGEFLLGRGGSVLLAENTEVIPEPSTLQPEEKPEEKKTGEERFLLTIEILEKEIRQLRQTLDKQKNYTS